MWTVRVALTGLLMTPGGAKEITGILKRKEALKRLAVVVQKLEKLSLREIHDAGELFAALAAYWSEITSYRSALGAIRYPSWLMRWSNAGRGYGPTC